jgi:hypothetical protein
MLAASRSTLKQWRPSDVGESSRAVRLPADWDSNLWWLFRTSGFPGRPESDMLSSVPKDSRAQGGAADGSFAEHPGVRQGRRGGKLCGGRPPAWRGQLSGHPAHQTARGIHRHAVVSPKYAVGEAVGDRRGVLQGMCGTRRRLDGLTDQMREIKSSPTGTLRIAGFVSALKR